MALLEVRDLSVSYLTLEGRLRALKDVSLDVQAGEVFGVIGESGSGKTTLALAILGLLPNNAVIEKGSIIFDGLMLTTLPRRQMEGVRGRRISAIFQDPSATLNPVFKIGEVLRDVLKHHVPSLDDAALRSRALTALRLAGLKDERILDSYPHQLSGGMQQRAALAVAIAPEPRLLIADEPTSQLDATIQVEVLNTLRSLKGLGMTILLITHHIGVVTHYCDRLAVLWEGEVVERGRVEEVVSDPKHEYTRQLMKVVPRVRP
jgi:ABC-type dipeptide/oligopeptide/nickel transport system ATPase component